MTAHSAAERSALVQELRAAGPDAATLCQGWTTRDLAAHLVVRERRPDSAPGLWVPLLAGWTERVRVAAARRPYPHLVHQIEAGPPRLSGFALPGVDAAANLSEHFVHCEDVRRAADGWAVRDLPAARQQALWRILTARGTLFFRGSPVPVVLATPGGSRHTVKPGDGGVVLTGPPGELLLYAFGRGEHSQVDVTGPPDAVARFRALTLRV